MFLDAKRDVGRSEGTLDTYGSAVSAHIIPKIGGLTVAEAKPERLQPFLNRIEKESGAGAAKNCRSTLSGMMALAVVNGATEKNPVRELERISRSGVNRRGSAAIPIDELLAFPAHARADAELMRWDIVGLLSDFTTLLFPARLMRYAIRRTLSARFATGGTCSAISNFLRIRFARPWRRFSTRRGCRPLR